MKKALLVLVLIAFTYTVNAQITNRIDMEGCGLNRIMKSVKIATRVTGPDTPGNTLPVTVQVSELPTPCFEIQAAYIWFIVSYNNGSPDPATVTVTNPLNLTSGIVATKEGQSISKCWAEQGTRCFRADVTNTISGNGTYTINLDTKSSETDGITLVIIYKDLKGGYQGHISLWDGLITHNADTEKSDFTIQTIAACENPNLAEAFLIVSDMQKNLSPAPPNWTATINGAPFSFERKFWNSELFPINYTQGQSSLAFHVDPVVADCYSVGMAGIYYSTLNCKTCPEPLLSTTATASSNNVCYGSNVQLSSSAAATYSWTSIPAGFTSSQQKPTTQVFQNTQFFVRTTDANNCKFGLASVSVNVYPPMNLTAPANLSVCKGSSVAINPTFSQTTPPYTFLWSPAAGIDNPNAQNVNASPSATTLYTLTVTDGNGCKETANVNVTVNPLPTASAGRDTSICMGSSITLNAKAGAGTPPFQYDWNPKTQITSGATTLTPTITVNATSDFYLTVTDANGCIARDTINIKAFPLPQPVITPSGPTRFCSCDSVILDAGNLGYVLWKWSTNETTQTIVVKTPGSWTVTVTDTNGCINTSKPLITTVIYPQTEVGFASSSYTANSGDTIKIPLVIKSSAQLDSCHSNNFTAVISFNKSLISPVLNTPKGIKTTEERTITVTGTRAQNDTTLSILNFIATLGDSEQTTLNIDSFVWTDCVFMTTQKSSVFGLGDLCKAGGVTRLIKQAPKTAILDIKPNPAGTSSIITYNLGNETSYSIELSDLLGQKILTIKDGKDKAGIYDSVVDFTKVLSGMYIITIKTQTETVSHMIEVQK